MKGARFVRLLTVVFTVLSVMRVHAQSWGGRDYDGEPWVKNVSKPYKVTKGLDGRHIAIWASHGRYYDAEKGGWQWQRPTLFCTNEDLYTQTIVVPYLIPMLENAGAVVFTPRERDWQRHEVIVDNDDHTRLINYIESDIKYPWTDAPRPGFAVHGGKYYDGENPFTAGTARQARTTSSKSKYSQISYQPNLPEAGRYAVYVSYQTVDDGIDDANYTVWHKGQKTEFHVNQLMGGSTWVYLGTFDFDKGCNQYNRVTLTNRSHHHGVVTADAVRFGGGMGNIERDGEVSGLPRCLEGARYSTQWMGMPYSLYVHQNDYKDDINTRSHSLNYVAGGSCYFPDTVGLRVPLELSLAVHSDAGYAPDGRSIFGSLGIYTTEKNGSTHFRSGLSRAASGVLASSLLNNASRDLKARYGNWVVRQLYDRNYSETRLPEVPSAIFETLSHQNFPDMRYGQDPDFKFTLARSIYKTLLHYVCNMHGERHYEIAPLAPQNIKVELGRKGEARLTWTATNDPQERDAEATAFVVYTATGSAGFDNGTFVRNSSYSLKLEPGVLYSFRVVATNKGGCSFPTEVVSACYEPRAAKTILIVNGFHRLSSPAVIDNDSLQGFNIAADAGVTYGRTAGWAGHQLVFNRNHIGREDESGLGYGETELAGMFIGGNDFNYIRTHATAIKAAGEYNIVSCSREWLDGGALPLDRYHMVDIILGLECNDGHSLIKYKTFTPAMQRLLYDYAAKGGALMVSGANIASDMIADNERQFMAQVLKCGSGGKDSSQSETVSGMSRTFDFYRHLNEHHYAAQWPDIVQPTVGATTAMTYAGGSSAAVAYSSNNFRSIALGFPFECIKDEGQQQAVMKEILKFLIQ